MNVCIHARDEESERAREAYGYINMCIYGGMHTHTHTHTGGRCAR